MQCRFAAPGQHLSAVLRSFPLICPLLCTLVRGFQVELWADARGLNNPAAGTFNTWALINLVSAAAVLQIYRSLTLRQPL